MVIVEGRMAKLIIRIASIESMYFGKTDVTAKGSSVIPRTDITIDTKIVTFFNPSCCMLLDS